jgi:hypothetical protein
MGNMFSYQPKRQSNHDSYYIPEEVMNLKGEPLYVLIARWGLLRKAPFFRDDVAKAFGLTERRAADLMRYLHNKKPAVESTLEKVLVDSEKSRYSKLCMQILSIGSDLNDHGKCAKNTRVSTPPGKMNKPVDSFCGMSLWNQLVLQKINL